VLKIENKLVAQKVVGVIGPDVDGAVPLRGRAIIQGDFKSGVEVILSLPFALL